MLTLLFYQDAADQALAPTDLDEALTDLAGIELDGHPSDPYRPGRWRDPDTGASCVIDRGAAPLEEDHVHPPTAYEGWREAGLSIGIPVSGPHWLCVETLQLVERLLARLPRLRTLDTEDTRLGQDDAGPGPWSRPRVLASWERLHNAQQEGRTDAWRMNRLASVCLWRYRRERRRGQGERPDLAWPETFVLLDNEQGMARSAAFWRDPTLALALPPVELLIVPRDGATGVMPAARLVESATAQALPLAQAAAITPSPSLSELFGRAELAPAARFRALGDLDWSD